ncbi:MAG: hypothetical protein R3B90_02535 [Planctomycetaceae bacterium]
MPPFGGTIRVVIVAEPTGPQFFYCSDVDAAREIIRVLRRPPTIEQVFHDVKEVWGSGQRQVRNLWANIAAWHVNLWLYTLVELWAWDRPAAELVHREDSPWDRAPTDVRATPTAAKPCPGGACAKNSSTARLHARSPGNSAPY